MKRQRSLSIVILGLLSGILTVGALGADAPAKAASRPAPVPNTWSGVERIVAIADVHGDFKQFVKALQTGGIPGPLLGSSGPMWYRGWASPNAADVAAQCDPVFKRYGVKHAVIGHTPQRSITPLGGGRVIAIDTGMCAYYGGSAAALVIEKTRYHAVYPGRKPVALKVDYKPPAAESQINIQYPLRLRSGQAARNFQFPNETNRQRHNVWRPTTMEIGIGYSPSSFPLAS